MPLRSATDYHPRTITAGVRMSIAQATASTSSAGDRRRAARPIRAALACAFSLGALPAAQAQAPAFPDRPVRVVVPFAPGGGTDNLIRLIAPAVQATLGQSLVIENRPGGASMIGTEMVVKSAPDGYTALAADSAITVNPGLFGAKMTFDTVKSLTGVSMLATAPVLLVVHPSVPAKTLPDLLALARAKPGTLNYASGGLGASTHLAGELLKLVAKVDIVHIPYKGTGPAMTDMLGGHVNMQFAGISTARPHVEAGKLRALAVTGRARNPAMREVPTFDELGVTGVEVDTFWGLYAPSATPAAAIATLNRAFVGAMKNPALADRLADQGFIPIANSPQDHTRQMREMIARWIDVIERAKIRVD
ncbi:MAG: tripartite tricarboxylate transporter substrate binding protein [Pseudomonadota bacterium]